MQALPTPRPGRHAPRGITLSLSVGLTNPSAAFHNISVGRPLVLN